MELKFYFYVAYFFIALFILYFFRVFNWTKLKELWYYTKLSKEQIDKAIAKGQKPFDVGRGKNKATVYAKSQMDAMLKHKKSQLINLMSSRKTLKKV